MGGMSAMVDSVEISRVNIRDTVSFDLSVWMNHPNDWDLETIQRDRVAELRVKFQVHGMHGRMKKIHPIIADGKAKKLATANWKTTQTVRFD
jgi:hypothetical protein